MKKLHKVALTAVVAMFALSASPLMENNHANVAQAATKRTTHHKKGTKKARYAKIRRRGNVYVTTFSGGYYYKDAALKHPAKKRGYKAGKTLRVKRVVLYHGLQRYQLTNGEYITAYHADFNYHYTYKRVAKKMVNHETIIKAHKAKKAKKARKAKKAKKTNKKKANKKQNNKKNNNSNKQIINGNEFLMQGKFTKSVQAPTDPNADPYAAKHNDGDVWYQLSADGKGNVIAKFAFENGNWITVFDLNNTDTISLQQGKLTKSIKAPTDKDAKDPYAGKHHEGDIWNQLSSDKKTTINVYTFTNNNWQKVAASVNGQTRDLIKSAVAPTDADANDPFAGLHQNGDKWLEISPNLTQTMFIYNNGKWEKQDPNNANNGDNNNDAKLNEFKSDFSDITTAEYDEDNPVAPKISSDQSPIKQLAEYAAIVEANNGTMDDVTPDFANNAVMIDGNVYKFDKNATINAQQ